MRIVSENSDQELAGRGRLITVQNDLRTLTANLLRVIRGAGKPYLIASQSCQLAISLAAYEETTGQPAIPDDLVDALNIRYNDELMARLREDALEEVYARDLITNGCLQVAASRLLNQKTQERAGSHEVFEGIQHLDALRKRQRADKARATKPKVRKTRRKARTARVGVETAAGNTTE